MKDKPLREASKPLIDRNLRKMYNLSIREQLRIKIAVELLIEGCLSPL